MIKGFCLMWTSSRVSTIRYSPTMPIPEKLPLSASPLKVTPFFAAAPLAFSITSAAGELSLNWKSLLTHHSLKLKAPWGAFLIVGSDQPLSLSGSNCALRDTRRPALVVTDCGVPHNLCNRCNRQTCSRNCGHWCPTHALDDHGSPCS